MYATKQTLITLTHFLEAMDFHFDSNRKEI